MLSRFHHVKDNKESGFTLIEILVVLAIMGIVAALTVPSFLNQRKSAVDDDVKADVVNASKQIETWRVRYPSKVIPNITVTELSSSSNIPAFRDLRTKKGKEITVVIKPIVGKPGNYIITGKSIRGKRSATTTGIVYDTTKGGLQS
ncbi:MAG: type II secretion system protein [Enterococcus sp.]|nr:type II secretion system protein [Enterococcus sp.]